VDVGEAALLGGVEVFARAEAVGHCRFDGELDRADTGAGGQIGGEIVACVREAKTDRGWLVESLVADLGSHMVGGDDIGIEVVDNRTPQCRTMLPVAAVDIGPVWLHYLVSDYGSGRTALGTRLGVGVEVGAATATHIDSALVGRW